MKREAYREIDKLGLHLLEQCVELSDNLNVPLWEVIARAERILFTMLLKDTHPETAARVWKDYRAQVRAMARARSEDLRAEVVRKLRRATSRLVERCARLLRTSTMITKCGCYKNRSGHPLR